jgi:formate dehydrogenase major subunit
VAIGMLERFASAFSIPSLLASPEPCTSPHDARAVAALAHRTVEEATRNARGGRSIAIIGGGATGLACAHDLALLGHRPVIFEGTTETGGVLARTLLAGRVSAASVRAECAAIEHLGVEVRRERRLDAPDTLERLFADGFEAIFLAIGAWHAAEPVLPDDMRGAKDATLLDAADIASGSEVAVCGSGDLAFDAALMLAASNRVHLVLTEPTSAHSPLRLAASARARIVVHVGIAPTRIVRAEEDDAIVGLELESEDATSLYVIPCTEVVLAPRLAPRAAFLSRLQRSSSGHVVVGPELRTSYPRVWAGGACAFGHRSIAHAVADGKRAAWHMHAALTGTRVRARVAAAWIELPEQPEQSDDAHARARAQLFGRRRALPLFQRPAADPFSSESAGSMQEIAQEAARCFDCAITPVVLDACTGCGKCVSSCPTSAITVEGEPRRALIEQDACTRCGACVSSCPESALAMVRAAWESRLALEPEPSTVIGLLDRPRLTSVSSA